MTQEYATLTDYKDRTIDVAAYQGWEEGADKQVTQALVLPGNPGAAIAGIEKLAQRFLIELFTEQGTLVYLPERGTTFMTEARIGAWRTPGDVQSSFGTASIQLLNNLKSEESATDPADERYESSQLLSVSILGADVTMSVKITSAAGTSRVVLLPLNVTPF